ncbi:MAG: nodulation protein NfeD [Acidimicrobiia bacterium]
MRRLAIACGVIGLVIGAIGSILAASAGAQQVIAAPVDVVKVSGLIDKVMVEFLDRTLTQAETDGAQAVVLQLNSKGAVVSRAEMAALATRIANSPVPVGIWVGPSGARAYGTVGQLLAAAPVTAMAPGTRIGNFGDPLSADGVTFEFGNATETLRSRTLGAKDARDQGALKLRGDDQGSPTMKNFIGSMNGLDYQGRTVSTLAGQNLTAPVQYRDLGIVARLLHTAASPPVAYLMLVIGFGLLAFEFFTAGVGVAGVVGVICLVLGCYGAAALPTRWWAFALLALSIVAFSVDIQTGVPRFWTGAGIVMFVVASFGLFRGYPLSWITLVAGIGGIMLAMLAGMPAMVRTRFSTPTIGREWMIGEVGEAVVAVDPDGVIRIQGALWKARTNRATPIAVGGSVRVVAIEGIVVEVEPTEGAARDYRERGPRS